MTFDDFKAALKNNQPPSRISDSLKALWYDAQGNWDRAHLLVQEELGQSGAWVHGYLHRKEGDLANAAYWYSRAGKNMPEISLDDEWESIARQLVSSE